MKLLELQKRMAADVMRPLTSSTISRPRPAPEYVIAQRSPHLAQTRLEIYNRQYWFRS